MQLYLMRHGPYLPKEQDPAQGLSPQGQEVIRAVARELKALGVRPEAVAASPKKRARQTALLAAEVLGYPSSDIRESDLLKAMTPPQQTMELLAGLGGEQVLVVGHLPNLALVASQLLTGEPEMEIVFQAGAACALELPHAPAGRARLLWLLPPRA